MATSGDPSADTATVDSDLSPGTTFPGKGSPGPNFALATRFSAVDSNPPASSPPLADPLPPGYQTSPGQKTAYTKLPPPAVGGLSTPFIVARRGAGSRKWARARGLGVAHYDAYAASPVHRFYQAWQQLDCNALYATEANPSGCLNDLFSWVEISVGAGTNGRPQPESFDDLTTGEGSTALGFYNVQAGDAPYRTSIADTYAMSDNFHQSVQGGTGANHVMLGTGDAVYYSDGNGTAMRPPEHEIENPDPQAGTNNWYTEDGDGSSDDSGNPIGGGSYSDCSDSDAPGVSAVTGLLSALPYEVDPKCVPGHFSPALGRLAARHWGPHLARVHGSRVDPEVHRTQLESPHGVEAQSRQPAEPGPKRTERLRADQRASDWGSVRLVRLCPQEVKASEAAS